MSNFYLFLSDHKNIIRNLLRYSRLCSSQIKTILNMFYSMSKICPRRIFNRYQLVRSYLHATVGYLFKSDWLLVPRSGSFIILLNAVVSRSVTETNLHSNRKIKLIKRSGSVYGKIFKKLFATNCNTSYLIGTRRQRERAMRWENMTLITVKLFGNKYCLLRAWNWLELEILFPAHINW